MTEEIVSLSDKLMSAVTITMSPLTTQEQRLEAYQFCENVKETSPLCAQCGLLLSKRGNQPIARHFGLALIEHCIKFRWNALTADEKLFIKNNIMELLATGTESILDEQLHIKDALAKLVVEMIKREWPQQWTTLLDELFTLCKMGETQKELVLLILLRLAEDVIVLQVVPPQRRREIYSGLTKNLPELWTFFLKTLNEHYVAFKNSAWTGADFKLQLENCPEQKKNESAIHCRVLETLLKTLSGGFLEGISLANLVMENCLLLRMLCHLLGEEKLQLLAADCLLLLVQRKGKIEERKPFMLLFSEEAMTAIFQAAKIAASSGSAKEHQYNFLKRLCEVLAGLGNQLSTMLGVISEIEIPSTFKMYLDTMLAFSQHPSQLLTSTTMVVWLPFYQHKIISLNQNIVTMTPTLLETVMEKLVKVGYPSRIDSPSCEYSQIDFDSDDDFSAFYNSFRVDIRDLIRSMTSLNPSLTFNYASKWLRNQLTQPIQLGDESENGFCSLNSPSALQWDALSLFLECTHSKTLIPEATEGLTLLESLIHYKTEDPLIQSSVLSCISALFNFLSTNQNLLTAVLEKIFSVVTFNVPGQTKANRSRSVKNVRRHACSSLIKISKNHPEMISPMFDLIYTHIKALCETQNESTQLSQMEKCSLFEVLVIICNEFNNYERQLYLLREIMFPVQAYWLTPEFQKTLASAVEFTSNLGLSSASVGPNTENPCGDFRSQLFYKVSLVLCVLKRCKWPTNQELARNGGFILEEGDNGSSISYRNPFMPCIAPLFETIFYIIRALNALWIPEVRKTFHPDFKNSLDVTEGEHLTILGMVPVRTDKEKALPCEKMRSFISQLYDSCIEILGNAGPVLGEEFYKTFKHSNIIFDSIFSSLEHISAHRLRFVIRSFFKPYTQFCPAKYEDAAILPVLTALCPFMYQKLEEKWELFNQRYGISQGYEAEMTETEEIFEDQMNRILTKEYLELIYVMLFSKRFKPESTNTMDEDMDQSQQASNDKITSRGAKLLGSDKICSAIVKTVFGALHWLDSNNSLKATSMAMHILKQLVADNILKKQEEAHFVFESILRGLIQLGEHDSNHSMLIGLGSQAYELLRPMFPSLGQILMRIPNTSEKSIQTFDENVFEKKISDKKKKEMFKKIVDPIAGQNIGQKYKRPVDILNLRPIARKKKIQEDSNGEADICQLFK